MYTWPPRASAYVSGKYQVHMLYHIAGKFGGGKVQQIW